MKLFAELSRYPCLLAIVSTITIGCGDENLPTYPVEGMVIFSDATPVRGGTIELQSVDHRINAVGQIDSQGKFQVTTFAKNDGAVAGRHKVVIIQFNIVEEYSQQHRHHAHSNSAVARKHASYDTSGLEIHVQANAKNDCRIVVEREPEAEPS
ncbi:MAG: carboxypeptidase regulatory-like domain-containing protein [Planctomycetaceae bacterium]|nr:carboxypeptidase regulatory-like domain-containing protein [Planctomycetaceae bacterium]